MVLHLPEPRVLLDGLTMVEGARWHDGRLWFAHWNSAEVVAVDLDGRAEVMAAGPPGFGWAFDWLPDGRLVTTGPQVLVHEPDGTTTVLSDRPGGEIVIGSTGDVHVNGFEFDFLGGAEMTPGWVDLITPDGTRRRVEDDLAFPNGMARTADGSTLVVSESMAGRLSAFTLGADGSLSDRRVWADGLGPDGIDSDPDGGIWVQTADTFAHAGSGPAGAVVRVLDGGEITHRVETDQNCFACALGGPDARHLFLLCNDFDGVDKVEEVTARRSARVLVTEIRA